MENPLPLRGNFTLLQESAPHWVAIDKPAGFYVHPPTGRQIPDEANALILMREQIGKWIYPVHRLDRATSGVLLFALSSEAASKLCGAFAEGSVQKTYLTIVRGYTQDEFVVDRPLKRESNETLAPSRTRFRTLARVELPIALGPFPSTRYSLVEAKPETGRFHQIRRHLAGLAHPIIGDTVHGDGKHNRIFRNELQAPGLWLRASELTFKDPFDETEKTIRAPLPDTWKSLLSRLGWSVL